MKRVLTIAVAVSLLLVACSHSKPAGPPVSKTIQDHLQNDAGLDLNGHKLTVVDKVGNTTLIVADNHRPDYDIKVIKKYLGKARKLPKQFADDQTTSFAAAEVADVNPLTFRITPAQAKQHLVLFVDDPNMLDNIKSQLVNGPGTGMGYTRTDGRTSTSVLNLKPEFQIPDGYLQKAAATEICNAMISVEPETSMVDRALANSQHTGGEIQIKSEIAVKLSLILQDTFCNSFSYAMWQAEQGIGYNEYKTAATSGTVSSQGQPRIIVFPKDIYETFA